MDRPTPLEKSALEYAVEMAKRRPNDQFALAEYEREFYERIERMQKLKMEE